MLRLAISARSYRKYTKLLGKGTFSNGSEVKICRHPSIIQSFCIETPRTIAKIKLIVTAPSRALFARAVAD